MKTARLIPCLLALLVAGGTAAQTPPLGRLFLTPDMRARLERQRQLDIKETRSLAGGTLRPDGVVVRSGGKSTIWVNNRPHSESDGATLDRAMRETGGGLTGGEIRIGR